MPSFSRDGITVEIDDSGFMTEPERWNEAVAAALARADGIETLSEEHWRVIAHLRGHYRRFGVAPMIRKLCRETGFPLARIYELFPAGPTKGACRVAGLPKPEGCV